jgi:transposase
MIKAVIRLKWQADLSHEQIASTLNISKGAVAKYVGLTHAAGLDWESIQDWSEQRLTSTLLPKANTSQPYITPDWGRIHRELDRKGVTLMLLWQEYVEAHPHGRTWRYTQFCGHYKDFAQTLKRSMRQHRRAGEKLRGLHGALARWRARPGLCLGHGRLQLRLRLRHARAAPG